METHRLVAEAQFVTRPTVPTIQEMLRATLVNGRAVAIPRGRYKNEGALQATVSAVAGQVGSTYIVVPQDGCVVAWLTPREGE